MISEFKKSQYNNFSLPLFVLLLRNILCICTSDKKKRQYIMYLHQTITCKYTVNMPGHTLRPKSKTQKGSSLPWEQLYL